MPSKRPTKKVLIITYYWPPAGGPGVQRVLKFTKYLREFGWEPVILTVENGEYPAMDASLVHDIPDGTKVYKTKALEPFQLYKVVSGQKKDSRIDNYVLKNKKTGFMARLSKWIRFNVFLPDARVGWVPFAIRQGRKILRDENIDLIFSSSPPHSLQLAAQQLARKSKLPWVADFRDPWTSIVYYQDEPRAAVARKFDERLERRVLREADRIVTISKATKDELDQIGQRKDTVVIYNGYDAADFSPQATNSQSQKIKITYAGFLSDTRIPQSLLTVLANAPTGKYADIELHLYGKSSAGFNQLVENLHLTSKVIHHGYVDHDTLVQNLCASDALLMVVDDVSDNKGILTGKLFDYMGTQKPIIAIGPKNGEVGQIIAHSDSGWYVEYDDVSGMEKCLNELTRGQYEFKFHTEDFERRNLTRKLAKVLDEVARS
ncbi:glycosyltransferase family 4 protein [Membranicola marinus]|uniref:Glycosyltransferase family 4 protein n=1 Tax=Membranihabitans marinus TaxID=1227546 RepID=A0A953HXB1_9BACT|nr:glycosyltransferase family 4 protein [Membranihabitans marinus]MBY5959920.1 glycosyltransferase family 4 protein [Membranihabitans marinus]